MLLLFPISAKARLETQKRASEAASRMKAEAELKLRRQKEREAARIALDKVVLWFIALFFCFLA